MMYRQGDVLLERVDLGLAPDAHPVPKDAGRAVLAYGEATGHAHAFHAPHVEQFETPSRERFVVIRGRKPAALLHEEHAPITVPPGLYRVRRQREWTDADEPRVVAD